ncbi:MAG: hypothetical protein Q8R24_00295 [Legionellaceae bacterium]|nr:hypothetical protein [Legionellaceae bacterium]
MASKIAAATLFLKRTVHGNFMSALCETTKYTAPELYDQLKTPRQKNHDWATFFTDTLFFPLTTVPGWLTGALVAPFIYYSFYLNLPAFFDAPSDLLYSDKTKFKTPLFSGGPFVIFGIPGVILGLIPGIAIAIVNFLGRLITNSGISAYRIAIKGLNLAVSDMQNADKKPLQIIPLNNIDKRNFVQRLFGLPGKIVGLAIGSVAYFTMTIPRVIASTAEHVVRIFCTAVNYPLKNSVVENLFKLPVDKRNKPEYGYGRTYGYGVLGIFPLGIASALSGLLLGSGIRLTVEMAGAIKQARAQSQSSDKKTPQDYIPTGECFVNKTEQPIGPPTPSSASQSKHNQIIPSRDEEKSVRSTLHFRYHTPAVVNRPPVIDDTSTTSEFGQI